MAGEKIDILIQEIQKVFAFEIGKEIQAEDDRTGEENQRLSMRLKSMAIQILSVAGQEAIKGLDERIEGAELDHDSLINKAKKGITRRL